ncbi:hypothetical protein B0T22DRAFT_424064 [Podospora appendiculata]|uniref:NAD(P)-binding domain-containing protein n=1 Tax=Podospora appendiculata TaxID=314037 RepID=A0AAE0XCW8_9PEZI|nr:hypothetical protein B0T22DRAFT_424064 [Podospora appendiculata]
MTITVGLAGITGKFGTLLATSLLKNPTVSLRGYARDPSKLSASLASSPNLSLTRGGAFDAAAIAPFVSGCDVVICSYLGDDKLMTDGQKLLIDACETAGVPRYVASDWTLDYTKLAPGEIASKDPMKVVKAYLETKSTVKGVHVFIGGFMDTLLSPFFQMWDPKAGTFRYRGEGDEVWEATSYANAADYTAAVAVDPGAVGIQKFIGDRATSKEIAAAIGRATGTEPKLERLGSLEELKTLMTETRDKDPANIYAYLPYFYEYYMINGLALFGPETDNAKYPEIKPESWEDFVRRSRQ